MRLIDADALKQNLSGNLEEVLWEIYHAPTVEPIKVGDVCKECWRGGGNAVEVVRCKDCKHYREADPDHPDCGWCNRMIWGTIRKGFFCADGERKTGD